MTHGLYKYVFAPGVSMHDVEAALVLALFGTESLCGESQVRLDAAHALSADERTCMIDATTQVGRVLNRLFIGFIRRELDAADYTVERVVAAASAAR